MSENNWAEYSRLVLKELETLASGIESLRSEMQDLKRDITLLRDREDRVTELRQWKEKVDEVVSSTQLQVLVNEVETLKTFKTKAITVFAIAQVAMAAFAWAVNFIK